jgi:hypothetical protein
MKKVRSELCQLFEQQNDFKEKTLNYKVLTDYRSCYSTRDGLQCPIFVLIGSTSLSVVSTIVHGKLFLQGNRKIILQIKIQHAICML